MQRAYADTNVFIALFAGAGHPLHAAALDLARRVAESDLRLIVTPVVVAELTYVADSVLGWSRHETGTRLSALIDADGIETPETATLQRALDLYARRSSLDFADAYLAASALEVGPATVASLDADLGRIKGLVRITG